MRWRRRRSWQRTLWPAGQAPPERQRRPRTPRPLCLGVSTRRRRSTLSTTLSAPRCRLTRRDGTRSPLRPTRSGRRWSTRATEPGSWRRRTETSWRRRQRVKRCGHSAGKVEGVGGEHRMRSAPASHRLSLTHAHPSPILPRSPLPCPPLPRRSCVGSRASCGTCRTRHCGWWPRTRSRTRRLRWHIGNGIPCKARRTRRGGDWRGLWTRPAGRRLRS